MNDFTLLAFGFLLLSNLIGIVSITIFLFQEKREQAWVNANPIPEFYPFLERN